MNVRQEILARLLVLVLLGTAVVVVGIPLVLREREPVLHARIAETGGWLPGSLIMQVGKPLTLRLTSDDVMHGFALGQSEMAPVDIFPGEISEVTLVFDRPGRYTFYCTRWCSLNHWRMRGVIDVTGPEGERVVPPENETPLYLALGLDIDTPHRAQVPLPAGKPSAERGAALNVTLPGDLDTQDDYRSHSPEQAFAALKDTPVLGELSDRELWDLVAALWRQNITPQSLENGRRLYVRNCAACHGEQGGGDGVFAAELASPAGDHAGMAQGEMTQPPAKFTDAAQMLSASPAHLQGKIIRGGMGTGMPYWGPIFTEQQTWDLVAFLWTFQFDLEEGN